MSSEEKSTAWYIYKIAIEESQKYLTKFLDETNNLVEAFGLGQFDEASDHATKALENLMVFLGMLTSTIFIQCIEDGSWPKGVRKANE